MKLKAISVACALAIGSMGTAHADQTSDMQAKLEALQLQIQQLQAQIAPIQKQQAQAAAAATAAPAATSGNSMKPGDDLTFRVGGGEVTIYGHADVSADYQTNGLKKYKNSDGTGISGDNSWMGDVSSNLSFFGVRGERPVNDDLKGVFQFETEISYAATPGASDQAPDGTAQKYSLGSRNSYVGLQSKTFGAIKLGKTDTPYKSSTARMDPFANTPGDYNAIMGNSGGDSRAEFDMRLPHSIWYESPNIHGYSFSALVSPGQNRSTDSTLYAMGEPDCSGGNSSGGTNGSVSGGTLSPSTCNDGSFGTAYSLSASYESGPLFLTAAYEMHKNVNRTGDELVAGTVGIRDEMAYKVGVQYVFPTKTTVNFIVERLKRDAITAALDERTHTATWLAVTQKLSAYDDLNFGWAHAGKTPGQPDSAIVDANGNTNSAGSSDNGANLYSVGWKHRFDKRTSVYATYSRLVNDYWGHYALGASGHGIVTRNYEGDKYNGGCSLDCSGLAAGYTAQALSVGVTYDF